jgi:Domain of unknown function (DUF4129)
LTFVLLAVLSLSGAQGRHGAASFDVPAYVAELERLSSQIAAAATPQEARIAADSARDRWFVTVGDEIVVVDVGWIDADLTAAANDSAEWPRVRARITQRLRAMRTEASEPQSRTVARPGTVLAGILSREEFQRSRGSRWLEEQRNRVSRWLLEMLDRLTGPLIGSRTAAITFGWIVSLAALSAFAVWLVAILMRRSRAAALELADLAPRRMAARELALSAMTALRAGDVRTAVRLGYRSALSRLHEQGTWQVDESRTPREYLQLLPHDDPRRSVISDLTRQFEQIRYGRRMTTTEDAHLVANSLERLGCLHAADRAI